MECLFIKYKATGNSINWVYTGHQYDKTNSTPKRSEERKHYFNKSNDIMYKADNIIIIL